MGGCAVPRARCQGLRGNAALAGRGTAGRQCCGGERAASNRTLPGGRTRLLAAAGALRARLDAQRLQHRSVEGGERGVECLCRRARPQQREQQRGQRRLVADVLRPRLLQRPQAIDHQAGHALQSSDGRRAGHPCAGLCAGGLCAAAGRRRRRPAAKCCRCLRPAAVLQQQRLELSIEFGLGQGLGGIAHGPTPAHDPLWGRRRVGDSRVVGRPCMRRVRSIFVAPALEVFICLTSSQDNHHLVLGPFVSCASARESPCQWRPATRHCRRPSKAGGQGSHVKCDARQQQLLAELSGWSRC